MKYLNKKFSVYLSGNEIYEKNYNKIFKRSNDSNTSEENRYIWVVSARDKDGYYIPVIVSKSKKTALQAFEKFKEREKNNSHWDWDFNHEPLIVLTRFIEEEK